MCAASEDTARETHREAMKVKTSVRKICKDCRVVRRGKYVRVVCKSNARHKQRQGFATMPFEAAAVPQVSMVQPLLAQSVWDSVAFTDGDGMLGELDDDGT